MERGPPGLFRCTSKADFTQLPAGAIPSKTTVTLDFYVAAERSEAKRRNLALLLSLIITSLLPLYTPQTHPSH